MSTAHPVSFLPSPELSRFCLVGGAGMLVNVVAFAAVSAGMSPGRLAAGVVAFLASAAHNFAWHRRWTFHARHAPALGQAARYLGVAGVGLGTQLLGLALISAMTGLPGIAAQGLAVLTVTPATFLASRDWAFARRAQPSTPSACRP